MSKYEIFSDYTTLNKKDTSDFMANISKLADEAFKNSDNKTRLLGNLVILEQYFNTLRDGLNKLGFNILAENPANCTTAVYTNEIDAYKIVQLMREKYSIEIAPSGGELKHKLFRVGNFGDIQIKDIKYFLKVLGSVLQEL